METCPGTYEKLADALELAGTTEIYLSTKSEIINYYRQEYPGDSAWKKPLARDLSAISGQRVDTIERRFRGDRLAKERVSGKNQAEYKALGQKLPGVRVPRKDLAGKKANVSFEGEVKISKDKRKRTIQKTLTGSQASRLRKGDIGVVFEAYGINPETVSSFCADDIRVQYQ